MADPKVCSQCNIEKATELFAFNKQRNKYRAECKDCLAIRNSINYLKNKDKVKVRKQKYYQDNRQEVDARHRLNRQSNLEVYRENERAYCNAKYRENPLYNLECRLRARIRGFVRKINKKETFSNELELSAIKTLGIDSRGFMKHIESLFKPSMSWNRSGEWHIDHIVPLDSAQSIEEAEALCHYTNLQPLWADENIRKGSRV